MTGLTNVLAYDEHQKVKGETELYDSCELANDLRDFKGIKGCGVA